MNESKKQEKGKIELYFRVGWITGFSVELDIKNVKHPRMVFHAHRNVLRFAVISCMTWFMTRVNHLTRMRFNRWLFRHLFDLALYEQRQSLLARVERIRAKLIPHDKVQGVI